MPLTDEYIFELDENVTRRHVSYKNRFGIRIAADLYVPKGLESGGVTLASVATPGVATAGNRLALSDIALAVPTDRAQAATNGSQGTNPGLSDR